MPLASLPVGIFLHANRCLSPFRASPFWENIGLDFGPDSPALTNPKERIHEIRDIDCRHRRRVGLERMRKNHRDAGSRAASNAGPAGRARTARPGGRTRKIKQHRHHAAAGKFIVDYVLDNHDGVEVDGLRKEIKNSCGWRYSPSPLTSRPHRGRLLSCTPPRLLRGTPSIPEADCYFLAARLRLAVFGPKPGSKCGPAMVPSTALPMMPCDKSFNARQIKSSFGVETT